MSVVNLFDLSHNFQQPGGGQEWLMQRYLHTQIAKQQQRQDAQAQQDAAGSKSLDNPVPLTPAPTYATQSQVVGEPGYHHAAGREMTAGSGTSAGGPMAD